MGAFVSSGLARRIAAALLLAYCAYVAYGIFGLESLRSIERIGRDTRHVSERAADVRNATWNHRVTLIGYRRRSA